ncbi:Na+/H+ antiporter NhaC family protein [Leptolyngbya iicbica]|uniref:Na+/H+ antiporter NhaC family protein n=2 Tax=Cyanophyceae TaxID=3028117 RepID=A0A4Q7EFF1_9CYAN|nr:Na+/H+ antiporter NhaC family protein [Leptolyngbya sp. LK]RZM81962.1 Na+/H+ antiporter NhaC family protein [Leptolyngbya sp. LK]
MDIAIALALAFMTLLIAVHRGVLIVWPLLFTLGLLSTVYWRRGTPLSVLRQHLFAGIRQSAGVLSILLLIGAVVASWLAAGTVPTLVYYGLQWLHPQYFLVSAFGLTALVSTLLGTSFGSAGTIGLALMIMARGAGVSEGWTAGAIIAGAYVGDRCSPMSSSAHLVAAITNTAVAQNLWRMVQTSWVPLLVSAIIYAGASRLHPLTVVDEALVTAIPTAFVVQPLTLLPAVLLIVLTLLQCPVLRTLWISLGSAIALALTLQSQSLGHVAATLLWGSRLPEDHDLSLIFQGGGLWPMARVCSVVLVSTALAGLLSGQGTFDRVGRLLSRWSSPRGRFGSTVLASVLTSAFGCTQTIAILLTQQITQPHYVATQAKADTLAVDIENSAVVIAPLIPWNIAGLVPATVILADASFIPYAVYLYLLPLWHWLWGCRKGRSPSHPSVALPKIDATTSPP